MGNLPLGERNSESGTSANTLGFGEQPKGSRETLTKKDSRSAFDPRDQVDISPYIYDYRF